MNEHDMRLDNNIKLYQDGFFDALKWLEIQSQDQNYLAGYAEGLIERDSSDYAEGFDDGFLQANLKNHDSWSYLLGYKKGKESRKTNDLK